MYKNIELQATLESIQDYVWGLEITYSFIEDDNQGVISYSDINIITDIINRLNRLKNRMFTNNQEKAMYYNNQKIINRTI